MYFMSFREGYLPLPTTNTPFPLVYTLIGSTRFPPNMRRAHYSNVTERPMTSFVWDTNATTKEEVEAMA